MVISRACTNATSISASSRCTAIAWRSACKHRLAFGISANWPYFCLQSQYDRHSKRNTAGRQKEVRRVILVGPQIRPDEPEVLRLQERSVGERALHPGCRWAPGRNETKIRAIHDAGGPLCVASRHNRKLGVVTGEIPAISWRRNSREAPPGLPPSWRRDNAGVRIRSTPTYTRHTLAALSRQ
jgi:hypothetical protein